MHAVEEHCFPYSGQGRHVSAGPGLMTNGSLQSSASFLHKSLAMTRLLRLAIALRRIPMAAILPWPARRSPCAGHAPMIRINRKQLSSGKCNSSNSLWLQRTMRSPQRF
ncbi:hypothetical protein [Noviherbaspirillum soli]|uniref:hypothetical protein n=1 Tax=Noviherbaspirillum soli TaxID=1064518 RepID=UPI00188C541C|nr:hypothetical protein [Noviherbaspirillum soli]